MWLVRYALANYMLEPVGQSFHDYYHGVTSAGDQEAAGSNHTAQPDSTNIIITICITMFTDMLKERSGLLSTNITEHKMWLNEQMLCLTICYVPDAPCVGSHRVVLWSQHKEWLPSQQPVKCWCLSSFLQLQTMVYFCLMKTPGKASGWSLEGHWTITCSAMG